MNQKYDVFISYRRDGGESTAKMLCDKLNNLGYRVFFDVESLRSGNFNTALYSVIDECKDFLLVLSPGALDRCKDEDDWVRLEIEHALAKNLNIIPVMLRGFDFPKELPRSIEVIRYKNGLQANYEYFDAFIQKLLNFLLSKPVSSKTGSQKMILCAAGIIGILLVLVIVQWLPKLKSDSGPDMSMAEEPNPDDKAEEEEVSPAEDERSDKDNYYNVLMEDKISLEEDSDKWVLGKEGLERSSIVTITFLDTLEDMPEDAWDVSAEQKGYVKAWIKAGEQTRQGTDGYDLYIASKGTIVPGSCNTLFAFYNNVTDINFNQFFYTGQAEDMYGMFYNCNSLKTLDLEQFDTSQVTNMSWMFGGCDNLESLDVGRFDTSRVTNMSDMFYKCSNLGSLDLGQFDTGQVTNMSWMFGDCNKLESLDLSGFDTSRVTDMYCMFIKCGGLKNLDLSGFDTGQVENMGYMFYKCSSLNSLDLSGFDTGQVTDMRYMFSSCSNLKVLDLEQFDTSQVADMGAMFYGCSALELLDVSGFNTGNTMNMYCMFYDCSSLKTLDVSGFDTSQATDMNYMFGKCSSLESLDLSKFDTAQAGDIKYILQGVNITAEDAGLVQ